MSILDSVMGAPGSQGAQGLMRSAVPTAEPSKAVRLQSAIASIVEHLKSHGRAEKDQSFSLRELQQVTRLRPLMPERSLAEIAAALERHSKVARDDYDKYTYRTAIPHVQDREGIKKELKRRLAKESVVGIPINDLEDCYLGAGRDLKTLIKTGEVIAVDHHIVANGRATATIFPRGPVFGVELKPLTDTQKKEVQKRQKKAGNGVGGSGSGDYGENSVYTPFDFTTVVRRGEGAPRHVPREERRRRRRARALRGGGRPLLRRRRRQRAHTPRGRLPCPLPPSTPSATHPPLLHPLNPPHAPLHRLAVPA